MSVVDDIKARLDIVETVSGYVALQKSGRSFKAVCPFHTEKTPSFIVNPERQSWRCFGACATGGDVFSFVMLSEGMDFGDALRLLAQRAGVALERGSSADRNDALYSVNQAAVRFYQDVLASAEGRHGLKYLDGRGVNDEARARFELGLSPGGWDGLKFYLLTHEFTEDQAVQAGLLHRGENGNTWDFFRGRLMFPIHDRRGRVAGFGGRALGDPSIEPGQSDILTMNVSASPTLREESGRSPSVGTDSSESLLKGSGHSSTPKYLNTPGTPIFDKRGILYGLHLAADTIRTQNTGIVVEGYMDVIAAHQHGYTNVVASMGTALTEQQVSQLKSLASDFVLALDPDAAGQEATLRSLEASWRVFESQAVDGRRRSVSALYQRKPITLKIAALPPDRDPDDLIREDAGEWERLTGEAVPLMDYLIPALASRFDLTASHGKAQVVEVLAPMIRAMDPLDQDHYLQGLAKELGVGVESVRASMGGGRNGAARGRRRSGPDQAPDVSQSSLSGKPEEALEDYTLALVLARPSLKEHIREFSPECFHRSEDREVFTRWLDCPTIDDLRKSLDESIHDRLTFLTQKELGPGDRRDSETALAQCLRRLEQRRLKEMQESLLASEDIGTPPPREMEDAIANVNSRIRETF